MKIPRQQCDKIKNIATMPQRCGVNPPSLQVIVDMDQTKKYSRIAGIFQICKLKPASRKLCFVGALAFKMIQDRFTDADGFGRGFDKFVVADVFKRVFEIHLAGRVQFFLSAVAF